MSAVPPEDQPSAPAPSPTAPWFLQGGGVARETARAVNWAETPLGPPEHWPSTLKTTLAMMFGARQPMFLWWGKQLVQFYNDGYLPSFGRGKHPSAMGQRGRECWQEIWPIIGPQIDDVMERAIGSWNEDALVPILRNGKIEEVYWSYTYSPVFEEGGTVGGTLVICTETTKRVLGERRANWLHALVAETSVAIDQASLTAKAFEVIARAAADVPFAGIYDRDPDTGTLAPSARTGLGASRSVALGQRVGAQLENRAATGPFLMTLPESPQPAQVVGSDVSRAELVRELYVAPLSPTSDRRPSFLVFGISPQLSFDDSYRRFLEQVAGQLQLARTRVDDLTEQAAARRVLERSQIEREDLLRELQTASRTKDEFLAMLGHELRNPLSPIVTALRLMRQKTKGELTREQLVIERQVNHLIRLVDDLLDVAKIARGKVELRREVVDVADVIAKAVEIASDLLEQRHHRLTIEAARGQFLCDADPVRLAQVIANLLTNAARYTDPSGDISVVVSQEHGDVVVMVKDNGIGISAEMLPRIFNLFEQADRSADRAQGGLGIGLALVENLVTLHGGTVAADSDGLGRGSTFTVRLPAVGRDQRSERAHARARPAPASTRSGRVLVVDDNLDAAELLEHALEATGYEVEMATDPITALEIAARFHPGVAILDIGLPVIDGYELATRLRALPGCADCRMIALTGYGQNHDRLRSLEAGFHEHLVKPVDVERLVRLVDAVNAVPAQLDLP